MSNSETWAKPGAEHSSAAIEEAFNAVKGHAPFAMPFDEIPTVDHFALCSIGDGRFTLVTVKNKSYVYRILLGIIDRHDRKRLKQDLNSRVSTETIAWFCATNEERMGLLDTIIYLRSLYDACVAILPDADLNPILNALAQLRARRDDELAAATAPLLADLPHKGPNSRYAIYEEEVPENLSFLLAGIREAVHLSPSWEKEVPLASRNDLMGEILRYLGCLKQKGIDLTKLTRQTVCQAENLMLFVKHLEGLGLTEPNQIIPRIERLKSALRLIGDDPEFRQIFSYLGQTARVRLDCLVPPDVARWLDQSFKREVHTLEKGEPRPPTEDIQDDMRRTLNNFFHVLAQGENPRFAGVVLIRLDLQKAFLAFEISLTHCETNTLISRLSELKMGFDRIIFEAAKDGVSFSTGTDGLGRKIKVLKGYLDKKKAVKVPDKISPDTIKKLGLMMIDDAYQRIESLCGLEAPYRGLRELAERYRDGMILVIFSCIALRVGDMASLLRGTNLTRQIDYHVYIEQMKNGDEYDGDLPPWVTPLLDRFYDDICHLIPLDGRKAANYAFPSRNGRGLTVSGFQKVVPKHTFHYLDQRIVCHDMRRIEATADLASPDKNLSLGSIVLRQRDPNMAPRYQSSEAKQGVSARFQGVRHNDKALRDLPSNFALKRKA
jgi:hypothetical protein